MIYANDNDKHAAHWLSRLPLQFDRIDSRSIKDVQADEIKDFTQCHFFAGIGGWPLALQLAGWPITSSVWTGSCPCQPFSAAGKRKGTSDERHLWPEFHRLIDQCRPSTIFGEQVASKDGRAWLASVRTDLEAMGYAVGAADLSAAGVGAPHIRQRLFWVSYADGRITSNRNVQCSGEHGFEPQSCSVDFRMADRNCEGLEERQEQPTRQERTTAERSSDAVRLDDSKRDRWQQGRNDNSIDERNVIATASQWRDIEWLPCSDGKARPVKPGIRVLAHGVSGRVAQLRGLGNAIVPAVAAQFIMAFMDLMEEMGRCGDE